MPFPKPNESKDEFISRFMKSKEAEKDYPDSKQRLAVAYSIWKKSKEELKDWHKLDFVIPITESISEAIIDGLTVKRIKGVAINATTTRNGITYSEKELMKSASTLINKPLLKDHDNKIDSIIGKVKEAHYNAIEKRVEFEAIVMDEDVKKKLDMGLLSSVSIGAMVKNLNETKEGVMAEGIDFVELSLVAVPADPDAGFDITHALSESLKLKKEEEETNSYLSELDINNQYNYKEVNRMESEIEDMKAKLLEKEKLISELSQENSAFKEAKMKEKKESLMIKFNEFLTLNELEASDTSTASIETLEFITSKINKKKIEVKKNDVKKAEEEVAEKKSETIIPEVKVEAKVETKIEEIVKVSEEIKTSELKSQIIVENPVPKKEILDGFVIELANRGKGFTIYKK